MLEDRKDKEAEFHNKLRDELLKTNKDSYDFLTSNSKFYSIVRSSRSFVNKIILENCRGKKILDYCCGNGRFSIFLAKNSVEVYGIDISEVSIENAKRAAVQEGIEKNTNFYVMDAEATQFPNNYFDIIVCYGVLHHLNIDRAFKELARIVKPEGVVICDEPLIYNPIFQFYRRKTPHLRSEWETDHILSKKEIDLSRKYFQEMKELRFFHLTTLIATPFRNTFLFKPLLSFFEVLDSAILRLPLLKWLSWQVVFVVGKPKK